MTDRLLVDFFYAHALGHAVEALQYCVGHAAAVPGREVSVLLNAATPTELATWCPAVSAVFPVDGPFLEPDPAAAQRLAAVPRDWDWVVDDTRRHQSFQLGLFPGMRDHYAASDAHLRTRRGRSVVGADRVGYLPHQPVRLDLPAAAGPRLPAGSATTPVRGSPSSPPGRATRRSTPRSPPGGWCSTP